MLSAQATDEGVNRATGPLFAEADTPAKMVALGEERLRDYIKTIGLYRNKAKNVIDLVVFRGGDAVSGWLFAALRGAGMEAGVISLATVPVTAVWFALALVLGRTHEHRTAVPLRQAQGERAVRGERVEP